MTAEVVIYWNSEFTLELRTMSWAAVMRNFAYCSFFDSRVIHRIVTCVKPSSFGEIDESFGSFSSWGFWWGSKGHRGEAREPSRIGGGCGIAQIEHFCCDMLMMWWNDLHADWDFLRFSVLFARPDLTVFVHPSRIFLSVIMCDWWTRWTLSLTIVSGSCNVSFSKTWKSKHMLTWSDADSRHHFAQLHNLWNQSQEHHLNTL